MDLPKNSQFYQCFRLGRYFAWQYRKMKITMSNVFCYVCRIKYIAKFPNELIKVLVFLNEKAATGEFNNMFFT